MYSCTSVLPISSKDSLTQNSAVDSRKDLQQQNVDKAFTDPFRDHQFRIHVPGCVIWQWPGRPASPPFSLILIAVTFSPCVFFGGISVYVFTQHAKRSKCSSFSKLVSEGSLESDRKLFVSRL